MFSIFNMNKMDINVEHFTQSAPSRKVHSAHQKNSCTNTEGASRVHGGISYANLLKQCVTVAPGKSFDYATHCLNGEWWKEHGHGPHLNETELKHLKGLHTCCTKKDA